MKREADTDLDTYAGPCEKVPAKFSEVSSVWADGQCIGCLDQWAAVKRGKFKYAGHILHNPVYPSPLLFFCFLGDPSSITS